MAFDDVVGKAAGTTVLLADDHPMLRTAIRLELEELGYRVCAEAGTADAAVEAALRERPQLCVLDVEMPGGGVAAATEITRSVPETRVVMLTVCRDAEVAAAARRAGAVDYLLKDISAEHLHSALAAALASDRLPLPGQ